MKITEQIQNLPLKQRKQLFFIILAGVLVVMVGAWVVLGQFSVSQDNTKTKEALFQNIEKSYNSAKAGFQDSQPK